MKKTKAIIVSGGSRGIGFAIVEHLLNNTNYYVATFSRQASAEIRSMLKKFGNRLLYASVDLSSAREISRFVDRMEKKFKRIDVLINNASIAIDNVLPLLTTKGIADTIDINLKGTLFLSHFCSRLMVRDGQGKIINMTSVAGLRGFSGLSVYGASKAGLIGFTKNLARELGKKNIQVNAVAPGFLETDMSVSLSTDQKNQIIRRTPLGRLGKMSDILNLIDFLISDRSNFITGHVFVIDGGLSC